MIHDCKLFGTGPFDCYLAPAGRIPNLLREISVLRELTFRQVGEGTGAAKDLDAFDRYYNHLFLWDREAHRLVGAYRVGLGNEIMNTRGPAGFYTNTLFRMSREMEPVLSKSVELGRSFIRPAYQRHRLPLFMLWQGILTVLVSHPSLRYVMGPVSISSQYKDLSRDLMVAFVQRNHYNHSLARHVQAKHPYRLNPDDKQEALLSASEDSLRKLDKIIAQIEPVAVSVPVLLKKYLQQNARIIGFNIDPDFSDALDGLMILDLEDLPERTVSNLKRGMEG